MLTVVMSWKLYFKQASYPLTKKEENATKLEKVDLSLERKGCYRLYNNGKMQAASTFKVESG